MELLALIILTPLILFVIVSLGIISASVVLNILSYTWPLLIVAAVFGLIKLNAHFSINSELDRVSPEFKAIREEMVKKQEEHFAKQRRKEPSDWDADKEIKKFKTARQKALDAYLREENEKKSL